MKKELLILAVALIFGQLTAQKGTSFQKIDAATIGDLKTIRTTNYSDNQQLFQLDAAAFRQSLASASENGSGNNGVEITLPNVQGENEKFMVWETSNFAPELRARFPEIKSYIGKGITDRSAYVRFSVDPAGIQTMVLRADNGAEFIEPYTADHTVYVLFDSRTRSKGHLPFTCGTMDQEMNNVALERAAAADDGIFRTYRLALSCTGEYGVFHGGTIAGALAGMNATMTRVNGVFDVDMAVKLEIIASTDQVIYTAAASDPYSAAGVGSDISNQNNANGWNIQLQNTLSGVLGNGAYDIGHLFGASGGGGNAGCIGCICEDDTTATLDKHKGSGYTSPADGIPQGDTFDIDYVVHEMGHQLGANHTFSHNIEGSGVNIEAGSGVTIMGYAGVTVDYDVQPHSLPFFAYRSILQMQSNLEDTTCSVNTTMTNSAPVVNAGSNYTIPMGTAFVLRGTGSDADGDVLTYVWEQNDNATSAVDQDQSVPYATKTVGPNFRSFNPTTSPDRYMPKYSTVLSGALASKWETVSDVARNLNFNFTARDRSPGAGQTKKDANLIIVSGTAGPFALTSQNLAGISWSQGTSETITWSVNNTTALAGSTNVNIKLSLDNGVTWPITLATNTPNDGNEAITVPNVASPNCRLWIEPTANTYYAVNAVPFAIGYTVTSTCNSYGNTTPFNFVSTTSSVFNYVRIVNVPTGGVISDVNVAFRVHHTFMSDVQVDVASPQNPNTFVKLHHSTCASDSGALSLNYSDGPGVVDCSLIVPNATVTAPVQTVAPVESLTAFDGQNPQGDWKFRVYDHSPGASGSIRFWSIEICTQTATLANEGFEFTDFTLYPNPNTGNFTVQFTSDSSNDIDIKVHDLRGRMIFENQYANTGLFSQQVQLDQVQTGVYLVTVQDGDKKIVKRIVVE